MKHGETFLKRKPAVLLKSVFGMSGEVTDDDDTNSDLPLTFDWREKGVITPAKF